MMRAPNAVDLEHLITDAMQRDDWATVTDLEPRLDAVTQPKQHPPMVASALWYAERGLHIFPLQPRLKIPHKGSRGCKDATTDKWKIIGWWQKSPDSNIGIATGHLVDVVDIDGLKGQTSRMHNWGMFTGLEVLGTVSTPRSGGMHLYVPRREGITNGAGLLPGVDYRGLGGYVVAPPSRNEQGIYTWIRPLDASALTISGAA